MKNKTLRAILRVAAVSAVAILLQACLDEGGGDSPDYSSPGGSGVAAPSSIIGYQMVQTVSQSGSDPGITVVQPGDTITYQFIDSTTILGEGLNTYPTTSWSYTTSGSVGTARLNFTNGYSEEELTFTSSSGGTYYSYNQLNSGGSGWHRGTFTVTGLGGGGGGSACQTNNTGEVTIYTTNSTGGAVSVQVDGSSVGSLTQYYPSGSPTCGVSSSGAAITRTLTSGSHTLYASDANGTWGPTSFTITQCGCLSYALN